ncbi:hypothetical protein U9M48_034693 [Paspalum notatum var. saurae]|uniref:Protein kinase domain-containing protein n=1 Tax=Paspalum notatum var. saurae TaxID=547442 RepID=A0AAQ3UDN5_PASNO
MRLMEAKRGTSPYFRCKVCEAPRTKAPTNKDYPRNNIIVGLASALHYLHFASPFDKKSILHRDSKPSNVMLNDVYEAKLGDFGLMRPVDLDRPSKTVTHGGTHAYIEPEYFKTGNPSRESDVYSFGILMLQLVFGELPTIIINDGKQLTNQLAEKAWGLYFRNELLDAVDAKLKVDGPTFTRNKAQIERVMLVGLYCVHPDRSMRPSSSRVMAYLKDREIQIPAPASVTAAGAPSDTTGNNNNGQASFSSSSATTTKTYNRSVTS